MVLLLPLDTPPPCVHEVPGAISCLSVGSLSAVDGGRTHRGRRQSWATLLGPGAR